MIQTITIEREYGSGAAEIARKLSIKLGWTLWDQKISEEIAKRLNCSVKAVQQREERPDSTFYRLMKVFMRGSYEERFHGTGTELLDSESLAHLFETVINELANRGPSVIVGRAAPWFLRDRPHHMGVFIYAHHEEKVKRLLASGKSEQEAEEELGHVDADRAAFVQRYYGKQWPTRELYHLMINSIIGDDAVIDLVLHEMDVLNKQNR